MTSIPAHASGLPLDLRRELVRFACRFAWLDGGPQPEERRLIRALAERLDLGPAGLLDVTEWLKTRPDPDTPIRLDSLPPEQRRLFLELAIAIADADKVRHPAERRALSWLTEQIVEIARAEGEVPS